MPYDAAKTYRTNNKMTSKEKSKKVTAVQHHQYDNISPATKLLEKRRNMYEVHEAFEKQKE